MQPPPYPNDEPQRLTSQIELARLSQVVSQISNGVVITDREGRVEWINEGFTRISGYTLEALMGRRPGDLLQGERTDPVAVARMSEALRRGDSFEVDIINYSRSGRLYWINISCNPLYDAAGELQGFMAIESDITERKQVEAAFKEQAQHTQAILDNIVDGIITIDQSGRIDSFNPATERIFGYAPEEVQGRNVKMLMPNPYHDAHDSYMHNYQTTGVARIIGIGREVVGLRKDGTEFPMELAVSAIMHQGQQMYVGIVRDITERKRVERMKSEFIATVSHELRTPLTAISGALGLLSGGVFGALPEQAQEMVAIAYKNSQHLTFLVNDLLDMEKLVAGKMRFEMKRQPLMPLIRQALEANRAYGVERRVTLALMGALPDVEVRVDGQRLMQLLSNLFSNAIKFSPEDGVVAVAVSVQSVQNEVVRVTVTDHGPGIPAEFHTRIFQKFAQADASDTRQKGGTGLGLAICKELVERMGGNIGFDSVEGEGASFFFELPLRYA